MLKIKLNLRRRRLWAVCLIWSMVTGGCAMVLLLPAACQAPPRITGQLTPSAYRSQRLMALAAEEAGLIPEIDTRLTRQLNLADVQIQRDWLADARATLANARDTLKSADAAKLNEHARLSGWISISELSRQAEDTVLANQACDGAVTALRAIDDPGRRCQYVLGIANELQYLKGKPAAAQLLVEAGPWLRSLDHLEKRRQAATSFAAALFNFDDYAGGQKLLRQDDDAAWRSETLAHLAAVTPGGNGAASFSAAPGSAQPSLFYGKNLSYKSVFQNQRNSQTTKD